jgi:hypothetical protein
MGEIDGAVTAFIEAACVPRGRGHASGTLEPTDGWGRTPLALAVKACVDSYWTYRRSPESVHALLSAGAPMDGATYPSGYAEVDLLLEAHGASRT